MRPGCVGEVCTLGPNAPPGQRFAVEPFTIFTVIRGEGVNPNRPVPRGKQIHRALEAVTTWNQDWQEVDTFPDLDDKVKLSILKKSQLFKGNLLYYHRRARAVWFPEHYTKQEENVHSLACYHRNLLFASLQVESLCGFISQTAKQHDQLQPLNPTHNECARRASGILGRLYGGVSSTYRTHSVPVHVEQNDMVAAVNKVRGYYPPMQPLS